MEQNKQTIQERLKPFITDESSEWMKEYKRHKINMWWKEPFIPLYIKWLTLKRKLKKFLNKIL